jgi:NitT/TauT family transport system substrate-binding protein
MFMPGFRKLVLRVICSALIVVSAAAISRPAASEELKKLTVSAGAPVPYIAFLPLYVAQQAGFLKEDGIDIDVNYASGAPQSTQLVAAGQADLGWQTVEPVISGYEKGIRGKIILRNNNQLIFYIAVPEDSPIKSVADLKGKKIGVSNLGSAAVPVVRSILRSAGIEPQSDTIQPIGVMDQAIAALKSNGVAALGLFDGIYYGLERAGYKFRYFHHPKLAGFGNGVVFANQNAVDKKREQLCGFGRAVGKATVFMIANPEAALRMWWKVSPAARRGATEHEAIQNGLAELLPLLKTYDIGFPPQQVYGNVDEVGFKSYMDLLQQEGMITKEPEVGDIVTSSFSSCINKFDSDQVRKMAREWK